MSDFDEKTIDQFMKQLIRNEKEAIEAVRELDIGHTASYPDWFYKNYPAVYEILVQKLVSESRLSKKESKDER